MTYTQTRDADALILTVKGKLTVNTSMELEAFLKNLPEDVKKFVMDIKEVDYLASAGLRILMNAHITMESRGGEFIVRNPDAMATETFEMTGMSDILTIEE